MLKRTGFICFFLMILLALSSCTPNWAKIDSDMASWHGAPADELYMSWGPPQGTQTLSNGNTIVSYSISTNLTSGGYYSGNVWIPEDNTTLTCKVLFTIDGNGQIINSSYDGNYGAIQQVVRPRPVQ
jgi:outer membrane lipoprotein-sorting protein